MKTTLTPLEAKYVRLKIAGYNSNRDVARALGFKPDHNDPQAHTNRVSNLHMDVRAKLGAARGETITQAAARLGIRL